MSLIQIRNVPEDVHRRLKERAAREGKTLSQLALEYVTRAAERPSLSEIRERLQTYPPREDIDSLAVIDEARAERDAELDRVNFPHRS